MLHLALPLAAAVAAVAAGAPTAVSHEPAKPAAAPAASTTTPALHLSPSAANAAKVRDRALAGDSVAWDVLASLTTEVGARPTGSPAMARAKDWAVDKLKRLGFKNVHVEAFTKKDAWLRGPESAAMTKPYAMPLRMIGLGKSPATPAGGIEAEIVVFNSYEALTLAPPGSLKGKIALVNEPMTRTQSGEGYGAAVKARGVGPRVAQERGAVAYFTRSIATGDGRAPHTGATGWGAAPADIPSAALGVADADLLARLAARGPVRVKLSMAPTVLPEAQAWNIVGEVPGRDRKAGVVVIGGHLDSWDPGEGAIDDGAGIAISVGAAKLIAELPNHARPRRTVRVVLFGSEETGGSGGAYADAHQSEVADIAMASESDLGAGPVYRVALPENAAADPALTGLADVLAPLRVFVARDPARFGGSDVDGLQEAGVPIIEVDEDATRYFDIHHSADDTLDKVDRKDLEQSTAAWAALVYFVADSGVDLRHPPQPLKDR